MVAVTHLGRDHIVETSARTVNITFYVDKKGNTVPVIGCGGP
jgi:hypothetical protein